MGTSSSAPSMKGYRVLAVQRGSAGAKSGLVSFFDFIIAANGKRFEFDDGSFKDLIQNSQDADLVLSVYNLKACNVREVTMVPTNKWAGRGLLGITIRFDTFEDADSNVLHVLDVVPGSPAADAGLSSFTDYILGTSQTVLTDSSDLAFAVEEHLDLDEPLHLWIYSTSSDEVRQVQIIPSEDWGGDGCLGCDIGSGYLHVLPAKSRDTLGKAVLTEPSLQTSPIPPAAQEMTQTVPSPATDTPATPSEAEAASSVAPPPAPVSAPATAATAVSSAASSGGDVQPSAADVAAPTAAASAGPQQQQQQQQQGEEAEAVEPAADCVTSVEIGSVAKASPAD